MPGRKKQGNERIRRLLDFDAQHDAIVVGVDEVGRGCLAGPVVAAACMMPAGDQLQDVLEDLSRLDDSKKLTAACRESLAQVIRSSCKFAIAEASVEEIDQINILHASLLAMQRAVQQLSLSTRKTILLVDGNKRIAGVKHKQKTVINGDGTSAAIAAASVIAKVHRDALMKQLSEEHPYYQWQKNKGYGSAEHRDAITEHGLTSLHRKKFCESFVAGAPQQLSLSLP